MPSDFSPIHFSARTCQRLRQLTSKHTKTIFLAALILSAAFTFPAGAAEVNGCAEVLTSKPRNNIDISPLLGQYERAASEYFGDNPTRLDRFQKIIGGLPFRLFSLTKDNDSPIARIERNEPFYSSYRERALDELRSMSKNRPSQEAKKFIDQYFRPIDLGEGTVMISFSLERLNELNLRSTAEKRFARFVLLHFQTFYEQMVGWVYQRQGLEDPSALSTGRLQDESREFTLLSRPVTFNLLFSTESWEVQKLWLEKYYEIFSSDPRAGDRIRLSPTVANPPALWPFAGVAVVKESKSNNPSVELKRYFKNDMEDPLELMPKQPTRDEFDLRHKLLLQAIAALPSGTALEIRSHTRIHTIAYRKLGFTSDGPIQDPKYPDAYVELLRSTRENAMNKIESILARKSATNELPRGK